MSVLSARRLWFCLLLLPPLLGLQCGPSRDAQLAKAKMHMQAGELDAARQIYSRILERRPYDADALQGMIDASPQEEDAGRRVEFCRRLLQLQPWDRDANLVVGRRLMEQGNLKDAAVRFYMAYLDSDFLQEKKEVIALLQEIKVQEIKIQEIKIQEQQRAASKAGISSGTENTHD
ncbi:MAG: tetratricopeptide repeat protein [Candidatus Omnitrophica bacterium]|nr:tetratricopeptide repeat protein [Candidatus Omnitrophota bacterium]